MSSTLVAMSRWSVADAPSLSGRTALVTGATSGLGLQTARALASRGARVLVAGRDAGRTAAAVEHAAAAAADGGSAEPLELDLASLASVRAAANDAASRTDRLDVLVNNAGLARGSEVETMPTDDYRTMMETNVDGMFFATRAALPHLRESEGTCVFVGSFAGQYPRPFNPVYAATKWWTRGFALSLAGQLAGDVAVTVVNPAAVRTEFSVGSSDDDADFDSESFAEQFAPGEAVEPEEVAEAIVYAVRQSPSMVAELDLYNREKFGLFG